MKMNMKPKRGKAQLWIKPVVHEMVIEDLSLDEEEEMNVVDMRVNEEVKIFHLGEIWIREWGR